MSLKFIAVTDQIPDITKGTTYEIVGLDLDGDAYFIDDAGEKNFSMANAECDLRKSGRWIPA